MYCTVSFHVNTGREGTSDCKLHWYPKFWEYTISYWLVLKQIWVLKKVLIWVVQNGYFERFNESPMQRNCAILLYLYTQFYLPTKKLMIKRLYNRILQRFAMSHFLKSKCCSLYITLFIYTKVIIK